MGLSGRTGGDNPRLFHSLGHRVYAQTHGSYAEPHASARCFTEEHTVLTPRLTAGFETHRVLERKKVEITEVRRLQVLMRGRERIEPPHLLTLN